MEYLRDRGPHQDVPVDAIIETFHRCYPALTAAGDPAPPGRFREEAEPLG
jgi:hypothetical protein